MKTQTLVSPVADAGRACGPDPEHQSYGSVAPSFLARPEGATVPVAVVPSRIEAELMAGLLRNYDLSAAVAADDAGGLVPALQMQGVRVLVAPSDEASARMLLAAVDDSPADDSPADDTPVDGTPSDARQPSAFQGWVSGLLGAGQGRQAPRHRRTS